MEGDVLGVQPNAPHPLGIRPWGSILFSSGSREKQSSDEEASDGGGDDANGVADVVDGIDGSDVARRRRRPPRPPPQKNKKRRRLGQNQSRPDPRLGLGDLRRLPDEALLIVVASLPARDLASVSCASRALYAFASSAADGGVEEEEEGDENDGGDKEGEKDRKEKRRPGIGGWRSATLSDFGGDWAWGGTWARTYAAAAWARKELLRSGKEKEDRGEQGTTTTSTKSSSSSPSSSSSSSLVVAAERALLPPPTGRLPAHPPRLRVPLFSDALYATWAAAAADPTPWLERDTLPRVDARSLSPEEFRARFDEPRVPVVLVGAARKWPAFAKWKDPEYLASVLGGKAQGEGKTEGKKEKKEKEEKEEEERKASTVHVGGVEVEWKHFVNYAATNADDLPLTVFDSKVLSRHEELRRDLEPGPPECLPVAREDDDDDGDDGDDDGDGDDGDDIPKKDTSKKKRRRERDLFSVLPKELRPDHEWLIVGGRRSGSGFHIDPNATSAWNAVVCGSKKWVFYPPGGPPPPGVVPSADLSMVTAPAALADWFRGFYDEAFGGGGGGEGGDGNGRDEDDNSRLRRPPFPFSSSSSSSSSTVHPLHRPLEGVVSAGDAVFVPRGWWHAVLNLETPTVAVTTNFVSRAGLAAALRWVRSGDASLVSGVRGEAARAELAAKWEQALREKCPEALEEAEARIAAEDAAVEERRAREKALASLFRATTTAAEAGGGGEAKSDKGKEAGPAAGFSFNFALEE